MCQFFDFFWVILSINSIVWLSIVHPPCTAKWVPQGSALGPVLFTLSFLSWGKTVCKHNITFCCCGDTQLQLLLVRLQLFCPCVCVCVCVVVVLLNDSYVHTICCSIWKHYLQRQRPDWSVGCWNLDFCHHVLAWTLHCMNMSVRLRYFNYVLSPLVGL